MLYLGLPEYRLPRDVVEAQVREILATGDITLKLNQTAGRNFTISELRREFDAVGFFLSGHPLDAIAHRDLAATSEMPGRC